MTMLLMEKGTAKGALDKIIEEWVEVFEADGKL